MALDLLVCIGVDHEKDLVGFVEKQIFKYDPRIITLEQPLNYCQWLDKSQIWLKDFEFHRYAQLAEHCRIPIYYCVDGNIDPGQWPFFSELEIASSLSFPKDRDKLIVNYQGITYNEKTYRRYTALSLISQKETTPEQKIKEFEGRNQFMAQAINKIVEKRTKAWFNQPIDCLMHIGGMAHFNLDAFKKYILKFPVEHSLPSPYSLIQDLVSAKKKMVIDAVNETVELCNQ
ncbi:MAG: hypothetical protein AABW48_01295 [Nanoarchaeota archaeon]